MIKRAVVIVLSTLVMGQVSPSTAEPAPDPVMENYHAYMQARQSGDLKAAALAGRKALDASILKSGDLGVTGPLALNLAYVEIGLGQEEQAIAPARQALKSAEAGARGVDRLAAQLVVGESELSVHPEGDVLPLKTALAAAERRADLEESIYPAAEALANAEGRQHRYSDMLADWTLAEHYAFAAAGKSALMKSRALTGEGIALVALHRDHEADTILLQAVDLLAPIAAETRNIAISDEESALANTWSVLYTERARQNSENVPDPQTRIFSERSFPKPTRRPELPDLPNLCGGKLTLGSNFHYPTDALFDLKVGVVTVRMALSSKSEILNVRVVGSFPENEGFKQVIIASAPQWKLEPISDPTKPCRVETADLLMPIVFQIGR